MKKIITLLLALALIFPVFTCFANAAGYSEYVTNSTPLTYDNSAVLNENILYNGSSRQSEKYISYTPNSQTYPVVFYGNKLYGRQTLSSAASQLISQGLTPVAGINADYFSFTSGLPLGMVMIDSVVTSSCTTEAALGIKADGSSFIGYPSLNTTMSFGNNTYTINHINKLRTVYGIYLLTDKFSANTRTSSAGYDVILKPESLDLKLGQPMKATVVDAFPSDGAIIIPEGCWVLTVDMKADSDKILTLESILVGTEMTINVTATNTKFNNAQYVVGGAEVLVIDGKINNGLTDGTAPRTAVGIKQNGEMLFYTVDGRQSGVSVGMTLTELAQRLIELGCVSALNLDGGGSTTIGVNYPANSGFNVVNKPSDGAQRTCANFLFLVSKKSSADSAKSIYVTADKRNVIKGTAVQLGAVGVDQYMNKTTLASPVTFTCDGGTIDANGVLTPTKTGKLTITATSGNITGYTTIYSTDVITGMDVYYNSASVSSLTVEPGGTAQLSAFITSFPRNASYTNNALTWSVSGDIGTITKDGLFTASRNGGTGKITATLAGSTKTVTVNIAQRAYLFEDFEGSLPFTPTEKTAVTLNTKNPALGRQCAHIVFSDVDSLPAQITTKATSAFLGMWVYGDLSLRNITLVFDNSSSATFALDFEGWKYITIENPAGAQKLTAIASDGDCELYIDHIVGTYTKAQDTTAPALSFTSVTPAMTTISVTDEELTHLSVAVDGATTAFTRTGNTITLTPYLASGLHRISVLATDIYGNMTRISRDITIDGEVANPFADTSTHWAKNYISFLYNKGIASGEILDTQERIYRPDSNMTRAEFAVLITKCMGYNLDSYADKALEFYDADSIPVWAENAIKAAVDNGLISGSYDLSGNVVFRPSATITRAEAVAVIGRTLAKGYEVKEFSFTDANTVPTWASSYFNTLVTLGVISGYDDGSVKPSRNITRAEAAKILYSLY